MLLSTFYWIGGGALLSTVICTVVNNLQHQQLKTIIPWLNEDLRRMFVTAGESAKARLISLEEVPKLEVWHNECKNYGLINILGLCAISWFIISGGLSHKLPYIPLVLSAMFLTSNIFFLPRAFSRLVETGYITNNYNLLIAAFEKADEIENKKETSHGGDTPRVD